jgi:hypothetical protein
MQNAMGMVTMPYRRHDCRCRSACCRQECLSEKAVQQCRFTRRERPHYRDLRRVSVPMLDKVPDLGLKCGEMWCVILDCPRVQKKPTQVFNGLLAYPIRMVTVSKVQSDT